MKRTTPLILIASLAIGAASLLAAGPKPDPTPDWRCQIVFRDAANDTIKSDGTTYRDGSDDVTCYIINEPGAAHDRWLFMKPTDNYRQPGPRSIRFVGQAYPQISGATASYPSFVDHGSLEVKEMATIEWNPNAPTFRDVLPIRAYLRHRQLPFAEGIARMDGDSNYTGDITGNINWDATSSVFVQPIDACSWQVTSYTTEEPDLLVSARGERTSTRTTPRVMRLTEGSRTQTIRGDFPMAFQFTVRVTANKLGCALP